MYNHLLTYNNYIGSVKWKIIYRNNNLCLKLRNVFIFIN